MQASPRHINIWRYRVLLGFVLVLLLAAAASALFQDSISEWLQQQLLWLDNAPWVIQAALAAGLLLTRVLFIPVTLPLVSLMGYLAPGGLTLCISVAAATLGDAIAFWLAQKGFRASAESVHPHILARINAGLAAHGFFYVLILKLLPIFPSPLVNLGLALTQVRFRIFLLASALAKLPLFSAVILATHWAATLR